METKRSTVLFGIVSTVFLLFLVLFTGRVLHLFGIAAISAASLFISRILFFGCLLFTWWYTVKIEKQNLLLWEEKKIGFWYYLLTIFVLILIIIVAVAIAGILLRIFKFNLQSEAMKALIPILRSNIWLLVFTCITAGVVEELVFRGYMLPRLLFLFKNHHAAIITSSVLFALLHAGYGTVANVVGPLLIGLIFSYYYQIFRNIKVLIICHIVWDLAVMFFKIR